MLVFERLITELGNGVELVVAASRAADAIDALVKAVHGAGGAILDHFLQQKVGAIVLQAAVQLALVRYVCVHCGVLYFEIGFFDHFD